MSLTEIGRFAHGAMDSELKISSFDSKSSGLSTTDTDGPWKTVHGIPSGVFLEL